MLTHMLHTFEIQCPSSFQAGIRNNTMLRDKCPNTPERTPQNQMFPKVGTLCSSFILLRPAHMLLVPPRYTDPAPSKLISENTIMRTSVLKLLSAHPTTKLPKTEIVVHNNFLPPAETNLMIQTYSETFEIYFPSSFRTGIR